MICFVRRCLLAAVAVGSLQISQSAADDPITEPVNCVRIGVTESLNRDTDPRLMLALIPPFRSMVSSCTGLECSLSDGGDAFQLATRLARGQLDFGIFQGIEFAWIQQKHPELIPCLTVVNSKPYLRACLVVPTCRQAAALSDLLKGSITVPLHSLDDAYEFLSKLCREQGLLPEKLLARLIQPSDAEEALDQVVEGMVTAAVVEEISLECYGRRKPGRFQRLGILQRSECFPATVIAYRAGGLRAETLRAFEAGMCGAHRSKRNREILTWLRVSAWTPVPADYQQRLAEILRVYPTPSGASQRIAFHSLIRQTNRLLGQPWSSLMSGHHEFFSSE